MPPAAASSATVRTAVLVPSVRRGRRVDALVVALVAVIGKAEGTGKLWHGHVSAVSVSPPYRRLGMARVLMKDLEQLSEKLSVRHSLAIVSVAAVHRR
jgi:ribosomal protein S18 acetylase RimI-like enzyme